jgi:hypothetical protein
MLHFLSTPHYFLYLRANHTAGDKLLKPVSGRPPTTKCRVFQLVIIMLLAGVVLVQLFIKQHF